MDMPLIKRWMIKTAGALVLLLALFLILTAAGLIWISSDAGRNWLATQAEEIVSTEELKLEIGEITTFDSGHIFIDHLALSDPRGKFLEIYDLHAGFRLTDFLGGNAYLRQLSAAKLHLQRLPENTNQTTQEKTISLQVPDLRIDKIVIDEILLAETITGRPERLAVEGKVLLSPDILKNDVSLTVTDLTAPKAHALMRLDFTPSQDKNKMLLRANIEDSGQGPLTHLLNIPSLKLSLEGDGPPTDWAGVIKGKVGKNISIFCDLQMSIGNQELEIISTGEWHAPQVKTRGKTIIAYSADNEKLQTEFQGNMSSNGIKLNGFKTVIAIEPEKALLGKWPKNGLNINTDGKWDSISIDDEKIPELANSNFDISGKLSGNTLEIKKLEIENETALLSANGNVNFTDSSLTADVLTTAPNLGNFLPELSGVAKAEIRLSGNFSPLDLSGKVILIAENLATPWPEFKTYLGAAPQAKTDIFLTDQGLILKDGVFVGEEIKPVHFSGQVGGTPMVNVNLSTDWEDYQITSELSFDQSKVNVGSLKISDDNLQVMAEGIYNVKTGEISANLTADPAPDIKLTAQASGTTSQINITGNVSKDPEPPFAFDFAGNINTEEDLQVKLSQLSGTLTENQVELLEPVTIIPANTIRIEGAKFSIAGGQLTLTAEAGPESINARIEAQNIPPSLAMLEADGSINGTAQLQGPYQNLTGSASIEIARINLPDTQDAQNNYITGEVDASYQNNNLSLTADLTGPAELEMQASASMPMSLVPFELKRSAPVDGSAKANINVGALARLAGLGQHRLDGNASLDLIAGGTFAQPTISGSGQLENGEYENLETGTILQNITASFEATGQAINVTSFTGESPNGGNVSGQGQIAFAKLANPDFNLEATLDEMQLADTDIMGIIVSGDINMTGDAKAADLSGDLQINRAEYYISGLGGSASYSGFTIIEKGGEEGLIVEKAGSPYTVALDVSIKANNSIFVRGPRIDTEWAGEIFVNGPLDDPEVNGEILVVRGNVQLLDTQVKLSEGSINFVNPDPANPALNLTGTFQGDEMDATINISGTARSPELSLSSDPPLPEDEILSQALFGSSVGDLSPVQALKLANMVAALSGKGGRGFDPLGRLRQAIGLDTISVGYEEGGAAISVGKYISDDVYIAVDQGATPESSAVRAEIEFTEDVEIETRLGGANESSVGINWKRDY